RNSASVALRWVSRALEFSRCARLIDRAARRASARAACLPNAEPSTAAAAAVRTWQTVNCGFFPPQLPTDLCQQKDAHGADDLVPHQTQIAATFPVIEPEFGLAVLEATLHVPPRQPGQEQWVRGHLRSRVAHEELRLLPVGYVAGDNHLESHPR